MKVPAVGEFDIEIERGQRSADSSDPKDRVRNGDVLSARRYKPA